MSEGQSDQERGQIQSQELVVASPNPNGGGPYGTGSYGYAEAYGDWLIGQEGGAEKDPSQILKELWISIQRRWWLVLAFTIAACFVSVIMAVRVRPQFTASTIVEVRPDFGKDSLWGEDPANDVGINTKILMFSSRPLLEGVVDRLDLSHNPEFLNISTNRPLSEVFHLILVDARLIRPNPPQRPAPAVDPPGRRPDANADSAPTSSPASATIPKLEDKQSDKVIAVLELGLKVEHMSNTDALKISFTHSDPELAAAVANGFADTFINLNYQNKINNISTTSDWLDRSTKDLNAKVQQAEQDLANYARDHRIYAMEGTTSLAGDKLVKLHDQALRAEMDLELKRSLYEAASQGKVAQLPEAFTDSTILALQDRLNQLSVNEAQLKVSYGDDNPNLQAVREQMAALTNEIASRRSTLQEKITNEYNLAVKNYSTISVALQQAEGEAAQQDQAAVQYQVLKQNADTARSMYNQFLQKAGQTRLDAAQQQNNASVIRPARVPKSPDGPNKASILLIGIVGGSLMGIGLAFAFEHFDKTIRSVADVSKFAQLPLLGAIPRIDGRNALRIKSNGWKDSRGLSLLHSSTKTDNANEKLGQASNGDGASTHPVRGALPSGKRDSAAGSETLNGYSSAAEAYRALRTSILLSASGTRPKTILFTSSQPGEGKTTTVINTAISLGQIGASVIVVDADLRKAVVRAEAEREQIAGLSSFLSSDSELDDVVHRLTLKNVSLLPCGIPVANAAELIGSQRMRALLNVLAACYDHVLIDSPPLMYVTDPVVLSSMAEGVILVVRSSKTKREALRQSRELLSSVGAKMMGVVLNDIDIKELAYNDLGPYKHYYSDRGKYRDQRGLSDLLG